MSIDLFTYIYIFASKFLCIDKNYKCNQYRAQKKIEQQEILDIMEEEGILDAEEGRQADEVDKLTGASVCIHVSSD
jgi:hypothetical protein